MSRLQDICDAIWTETTRELLDGSPLTPANLLEEICNACWTYTGGSGRTLTGSGVFEESVTFTTTLNISEVDQLNAYNTLTLANILNISEVDQLNAYNTLILANTLIYDHTELLDTHVRYWLGIDTNWSNINNWAYTEGGGGGAPIPTANDSVYFITNVGNCTLTAASTCKNFTLGGTFVNIVSTSTSNYQLDITGDLILGGGGYFNNNAGLTTVAGNLLCHEGSGTFGSVTSGNELRFTGSGKTMSWDGSTDQTDIYGEIKIATGASYTITTAGVNLSLGTLTINGSLVVDISVSVNSLTVATTGSLTGAGYVIGPGVFIQQGSGVFAPAELKLSTYFSVVGCLGGGTFDCPITCSINSSSTRTMTPSGTNILLHNFTITKAGSGTFVLAHNTNNPNYTFHGDVSITVSGGSITWTKGTGTLTIAGASNQNIDFEAKTIEDVVINKSGGRATFVAGFTTDSFTFNDGDLDINGMIITSVGNVDINGGAGLARFHDGTGYSMSDGKFIVQGNLTMDGTSGNLLYIRDLDFNINSPDTGVVTYCSVYDSINDGNINIDATDASNVNEGGTNTGWSFGEGPGLTILNFETGYGRGYYRGYALGCR